MTLAINALGRLIRNLAGNIVECFHIGPVVCDDCNGPAPSGWWVSLAGIVNCEGCLDRAASLDSWDNFAGCNSVNGMYFVPFTNDILAGGGLACQTVDGPCKYRAIFDASVTNDQYDGFPFCTVLDEERSADRIRIDICALLPDEILVKVMVAISNSEEPDEPFVQQAIFSCVISDENLTECFDLAVGGDAEGLETDNVSTCADQALSVTTFTDGPWCDGGSVIIYPFDPCDDADGWSEFVSYLEHDVVTASDNECYVAKIDNIGKDPVSSPDEWAIFG